MPEMSPFEQVHDAATDLTDMYGPPSDWPAMRHPNKLLPLTFDQRIDNLRSNDD
jgi:hypothetical protein